MRLFLLTFPIALTLLYLALLVPDATRPLMVRLTEENHPIEILTFLICLVAGVRGMQVALRLGALRAGAAWQCFYFLFAAALLLIAMEEISWGQWFFHFQTPKAISEMNTQQEFNLHNLRGMGGNTEYLRLAFGVGGLIGVALSWWPRFALVAAPRVLLPWFAIVTVYSAADLLCDLMGSTGNLAKAMDVMSEVIELLIAMSALQYFRLKRAALATGMPATPLSQIPRKTAAGRRMANPLPQ